MRVQNDRTLRCPVAAYPWRSHIMLTSTCSWENPYDSRERSIMRKHIANCPTGRNPEHHKRKVEADGSHRHQMRLIEWLDTFQAPPLYRESMSIYGY